jgi:hypothetical protein
MVVMEELGPMCDGGDCWVWSHIGNRWWGSATYRWGQSSPIRLVFWVELGPGRVVVGSGGSKTWLGADSWV